MYSIVYSIGNKKNTIRLYKDYAELVVTYKGQEIAYKIDSTDMCEIMNHAWGYNGKNCVRRGERGPSLQYTLYGVESGRKNPLVHKNNDKFDCRKDNLEFKRRKQD